jgi:NAD-specific glutamate dehydrogenase
VAGVGSGPGSAPSLATAHPTQHRAQLARIVDRDRGAIVSLDGKMTELGTEAHRAARARTAERLVDMGIAPATAARFAGLGDLASALDIAAVARSLGHEAVVVADGYLVLCETIGVDVISDLLARHVPAHHWAREARSVLAAELRLVAHDATREAFAEAGAETAAEAVVARWAGRRADALGRARAVVDAVAADPAGGLDALTVGVRALRSLVG